MKDSLGVAILVLIAAQLPNNDSFVYGDDRQRNKYMENCKILPREAVKIMSGFSEEVAIAVTHPECPAREPKNRRDSAIV